MKFYFYFCFFNYCFGKERIKNNCVREKQSGICDFKPLFNFSMGILKLKEGRQIL